MVNGIFNGFAQRVLASAVCATACVSGAQAASTRDLTAADITNPSTQFFNPANNHIYEIVTTLQLWEQARDAAAAKSIAGAAGYLVTITSASENAFVTSLLPGPPIGGPPIANYWMGGSDAGVEGVWNWVVGPESGTQFWQSNSQAVPNHAGGVAVGGAYTNWALEYLDNWAGFDDLAGPQLGADYANIINCIGTDVFGRATCGKWEDANYLDTLGYIVEYSGPVSADVPIPGTIALLGLGLVGIGAARRNPKQRGV
jgi:hypothetical protein